ncbi:GspH/FimT family pseudopilin [Pseudomonas sp. JS3066]|jgi:type IV fimbrial biogenesis protein FimT|uniref:GspH/FimT family pseudopilin n=1 Tax=unclassified Pseudomonas TaxID=196821 RepID=UPI002E7B8A9C|nr:GspH/FimT family pseudopilin [Pseudomonas sp. JS3066]WVK94039.1 GspH/FimT family pseudopilin [Pseudomonas sp. JS3066]
MKLSQQAAVTLTELLIVLVIICATAMLAPSFIEFASKARVRHYEQQLFLLVQQARIHAATHRARVTVCPLDDNQMCHRNWNAQISAFEDPTGKRHLNHDDKLIATLPALPLIVVDWKGMGGNRAIHFNLHGHTAVTNGRFRLCRQGKVIRELVLNRQGRLRRSVTEDSQC